MSKWRRHRRIWHPDYEILPPRDERDRSRSLAAKTINPTYKLLSRPDDFTRPYSRTLKGIKSVVAAATLLTATKRKPDIDARHWHPAKIFRPAKTVTGSSASISPKLKPKIYRPGDRGFRSSKKHTTPLAYARRVFEFPTSVIPCIQRKVRREVIMALHGGGASHAKKRRNHNSNIGC